MFVYDVELSSSTGAYLVNSPLVDTYLGAKPRNCFKLVLPRGGDCTAWLQTTRALGANQALWFSYGVGSTHNKAIRDAAAQRAARSPKVNAKRRAVAEQLAAARAAKAQKRSSMPDPRAASHAPPS